MSGAEPVRRPSLPDDAPSPEVLDELLRAFAADGQDPAKLDAVDLTSPEVADLLTPTPRGDDPEPAAERDDDADDDEADGRDGNDDRGDDVVAVDAHDAPHDDDGGDGVADPDDAEPPDDALHHDDDEPPAATADAEAGGEEQPVRVAGDPFLGGARREETDEVPEPPGPRTISIVDDGLPDTIYLGGNLASPTDTNRSTVVIEDSSSPIISVEDAASATQIEPRLQDRRKAVKKAATRKRLKWAILLTALILVVVAALAVLGSGLFAIEEVRVEGAERTDPEALAAVIAELEGTPVLRADTEAAEQALERLPWVEDARVTTDFPDAATIEIRERTPAAAFQAEDGEWRLVDDQGRVLETFDEAPEGFLPIRGSDFPDFDVGQYGPPGLAAAATLARSLTPTVAARAAEITVTPNGSDLRLHFTDGIEVRFGAADELVQKLVRLETKLRDLGGEHVNYLDVSTNEVGQG